MIVGSRRPQINLIRSVDAVHGHPVIDRSFPLAELADAFRLQETGGHFGTLVAEYSQTPQLGTSDHEGSHRLRAP